tara:strand:+ start:261 stop:473 length:213 start_codon:yes stop_codon:yes gene_type:complete
LIIPDELKKPEKTNATIFYFRTVSAPRGILNPNWKWSQCIKPVAETKSCQAGHIGIISQGTLKVVHDDRN